EVGVDGEAGNTEGVAQHHVGGLAAHTRQFHQVFQPVGNFSAVFVAQPLAKRDDVARLGAVEASGADDVFELLLVGRSIVGCRAVAGEQHGGHLVDPPVRALGRQDGGYQEF